MNRQVLKDDINIYRKILKMTYCNSELSPHTHENWHTKESQKKIVMAWIVY